MSVKDARDLMIEQPVGSNVYFRPLTKVIWFAMQDELPEVLTIARTMHMAADLRWICNRKAVHPQ